MPSIGGSFDNTVGIIVSMGATKGGMTRKTPINPPIIRFPALVDTGASCTCLSSAVIANLGISPTGKTEVATAGGRHSASVYLVDLTIFYGDESVALPNMEVTEFNIDASSRFQALLGIDVLSTGVFTMSFDGHFTLSH